MKGGGLFLRGLGNGERRGIVPKSDSLKGKGVEKDLKREGGKSVPCLGRADKKKLQVLSSCSRGGRRRKSKKRGQGRSGPVELAQNNNRGRPATSSVWRKASITCGAEI